MKVKATAAVAILVLTTTSCNTASDSGVNSGGYEAKSVRITDLEVSKDADQRLRAEALKDIRVEVSAGHVTLRGQVQGEDQKQLAESVVRSTPGVTGVTNKIEIAVAKESSTVVHESAAEKNRNVNTNKPGGPARKRSP